jgi:hypothetical protein
MEFSKKAAGCSSVAAGRALGSERQLPTGRHQAAHTRRAMGRWSSSTETDVVANVASSAVAVPERITAQSYGVSLTGFGIALSAGLLSGLGYGILKDELFPPTGQPERGTEKILRDAMLLGVGGASLVAGLYLMAPTSMRAQYLAPILVSG